MLEIKFPENCRFMEDLVLQRTGPFIKLGGAAPLGQWMANGQRAQLLAFLTTNNLLQSYLKEVIREISDEVDNLVSSLPPRSYTRVASIGPGNGIVELLLTKRMPVKAMFLIDIEESDGHQHGFASHGSGYASLRATRDFLVANGVPAGSISACNPKKTSLSAFPSDLILSILSMGFHYPCDDYADFIQQSLQGGGQAVFDKRRGAADTGYDAIGRSLRLVKSVPFKKSDRVYFQK
jgi:hypothetical protein